LIPFKFRSGWGFHCGYAALGNSSDLFSSLKAKRPRRFRRLKKTPEFCVETSDTN